jgi:hypothetical protein
VQLFGKLQIDETKLPLKHRHIADAHAPAQRLRYRLPKMPILPHGIKQKEFTEDIWSQL